MFAKRKLMRHLSVTSLWAGKPERVV